MKYQLSNHETNRRFYEITTQGRDQLWKITGIDGDAIRKLSKDVNQQLINLADSVKGELKDLASAKSVAEQQEKSLKRLKKMIELEAQGVIPAGSIDDFQIQPFCNCGIAVFAEFLSHQDASFINNDPPNQADPGWDPPPPEHSSGHPLVDARGNGALSVASLDSSYTFTFVPASTGLYCIRPVVQLSGHYLAWTWGGCEQEPGRACVRVRVEVEVEQPEDNVIQTQNTTVLNECAAVPSGDSALQSGFAYDSAFQPADTGINTVLMSGEQVRVRVTCSLFAQVFNFGRAWVDMQTSPQFYFRVPYVRWGQMICS